MSANTEVVLVTRPVGAPKPEYFAARPAPAPETGAGEIELKLLWLSVDPYMRGRMTDAKSYIAPFEPGEALEGGAVAEVTASDNPKFAVGDKVTGMLKWRAIQSHTGEGLTKLDPALPNPSWALGVLGMPGMTAWAGLTLHGKPKEGETIVVSAATGAVGSLVCQLAKAKGLRVVGVAGGSEKCAYAVEQLGCDVCVDHRDPDLKKKLKDACPKGVDIYFENVGGVTLEAVLPLLNPFSRIPLCGRIAHYNDTELPAGPDKSGLLWRLMLVNRVTVRGFIVTDHWDKFPEFLAEVTPMLMSGKVKVKETVMEGLENAPSAFIKLLEGGNMGKMVVKVA